MPSAVMLSVVFLSVEAPLIRTDNQEKEYTSKVLYELTIWSEYIFGGLIFPQLTVARPTVARPTVARLTVARPTGARLTVARPTVAQPDMRPTYGDTSPISLSGATYAGP